MHAVVVLWYVVATLTARRNKKKKTGWFPTIISAFVSFSFERNCLSNLGASILGVAVVKKSPIWFVCTISFPLWGLHSETIYLQSWSQGIFQLNVWSKSPDRSLWPQSPPGWKCYQWPLHLAPGPEPSLRDGCNEGRTLILHWCECVCVIWVWCVCICDVSVVCVWCECGVCVWCVCVWCVWRVCVNDECVWCGVCVCVMRVCVMRVCVCVCVWVYVWRQNNITI